MGDGRSTMVSERYLGSAGDIAAALDARERAIRPEPTRHLSFGDVAAVWGLLERLGVVGLVDEVLGARRSDAGASVGRYLALAALGRLVDPCSKRAFGKWWRTTAADRFTKISAGVLDHRKFSDAMHAVTDTELAEIAHRLALRMIETFELDVSALALDMTNFATYIDTTNERAPIAQRGKAKGETHGSAAGRAGSDRHPRRRRAAGVSRLPRQPARPHPVRHHDRPAGRPPRRDHRRPRRGPGRAQRGDGGLRRRGRTRSPTSPT